MTTTDPAAVDPYGYAPGPSRRRRPRVREGVIALVCLGLVAVAIVIGTGSDSSNRPAAPPPSSSAGLTAKQQARFQAIKSLLAERSAAILHRDRTAFAATLDPDHRSFRRSQLAIFANLTKIKFSRWSYQLSATTTPRQQRALRKYDVPAFVPDRFFERYAIAGFDPAPTTLTEYPTFVERSGHWYLTSLADERPIKEVSATQIWDYGPVDVVRRPHVLVIGAPSELAIMRAAADATEAGIPRVSAVWGSNWLRRAVVQVPATIKEMGRITDDSGDLHRIAALTSSEIDASRGFVPVGDRITLNPVVWPKMSSLGIEVVLTHELTHVATRNDVGGQTPTWLSEGFADYVGQLSLPLSASQIASELASRVQAGRVPRRLPSAAAFNGRNPNIAVAYESGWMACRFIAGRYGQARLVRFYRAVGNSTFTQPRSLNDALRSVLHLTPQAFVDGWRHFMRQQL